MIQPSEIHVHCSPTEIRHAAYLFRDYQFKRYGPVLSIACIINLAAFLFALQAGDVDATLLTIAGVIAITGPVWLVYKYFLYPHLMVASLKSVFDSEVLVSLEADAFSFSRDGRESTIRWSDVKSILETDLIFMFVLSPVLFTFLPKSALSHELSSFLREKLQAAKN